MTDQMFDDFVKGKLEHYDSGAPMHVWERIREKEKDDRKGFFFFRRFLLAGILLLTLTGIGYFTAKQMKKTDSANADQQLPAPSTASQHNPTNDPNQQNNPVAHNGTSASNAATATNSSTVNDQHTAVIPTSNNQNESTVHNSETDLTINTIRTSEPVSSKNKTISKRLFNRTSKQKSGKQINQQSAKDDIAVNEDASVSDQPTQYKRLDLATALIKFAAGNLHPASIPYNVKQPGCPTVNGPRRNDLYIEVYGSPDYTLRTFSSTSLYDNYVNERRTVENNRNGFSAGVRIAKNIGEKVLIKGGVNYSQINERLHLINYNEKQLTQVITIRTVIRAPGDTLFIRDTTYFEQTGTRYRTTYNRYRFIDIPVIFSYEFGNPEILSFSVNAGPVFNITSFYKGSVLDTAYSPVQISTSKGNGPNNWRSNIGVGVFASFSIYKPVGNNLQLFAEPYFRYNLRPVTQSSNFVVQRYSVSGMQLGLRYNFHNGRQRYR